MTAAWVAAVVRGEQLLHRTVGVGIARSLVDASSWDDARDVVRTTAYGDELATDADRGEARQAAIEATAWQLRVLSGWLPPTAASLVRLAAAPIEIANVESHLSRLEGVEARATPVELGSLAVAWPRVAQASTATEVRSVLARSVWGDPGGADAATIAVGLRAAWCRRALLAPTIANRWARGAAAVLAARERWTFDREVAPATARDLDRLLGPRWRTALSLDEFRRVVRADARWPLHDVTEPSELWRSELSLLHRIANDAEAAVARRRYTAETVAAVLALLLVDLWRIAAGIAGAADPAGQEVFDAVA